MNTLNHVKFLCLRMLEVPEKNVGEKMQRNLHSNVDYYFYDGVIIEEEYIELLSKVPQQLYNIAKQAFQRPPLEVNICAVVGENGSGKSTVIDFIVRILNNLSAYILGEYYRSPSAEHLHFIEDVYAELYVLIDDCVLKIQCKGNRISATRYNYLAETFRFEKTNAPINIDATLKNGDIFEGEKDKIGLLRSFCYTIINNYSHYSFNSLNYLDEMTSFKKESQIRKKGRENGYDVKILEEIREKCKKDGSKNVQNEAQSWLQGLFHKNDGYQVPIVITPMRELGHIDLQKEYKLAKERLLSLIFIKKENHNEPFFYRINGKLIVDGVYIRKDYNEEAKYKDADNSSCYLPNASLDTFHHIHDFIIRIIRSEIEIVGEQRNHSMLVWNYIVHKILKIVFTYPRYSGERIVLTNIGDNLSEEEQQTIRDIVVDILHDHSHVTRKLFRSIYYLKYEHINQRKFLSIKDFGETITKIVNSTNNLYSPQNIDELLPPPIFHIDFKLYDINDIKKERRIAFNTLSSGEKQIIYVLSSFYYHLANLDSVSNFGYRPNHRKRSKIQEQNRNFVSTIQYRHVNIVFDEIELYFHPEMQRTFVSNLLDGLGQMKFKQLRSIQIMLVTHSPFILSDIPRENVLFLGKDGYPKRIEDMCTFGANIHCMLKHSFFLYNGSMGEYAQNTIKKIVDKLNFYNLVNQFRNIEKEVLPAEKKEKMQYLKDSNYRMIKLLPIEMQKKIDKQRFDEILKEEFNEMPLIKQFIDLIQEPLVKYSLKEQYQKLENYVDTQA